MSAYRLNEGHRVGMNDGEEALWLVRTDLHRNVGSDGLLVETVSGKPVRWRLATGGAWTSNDLATVAKMLRAELGCAHAYLEADATCAPCGRRMTQDAYPIGSREALAELAEHDALEASRERW